MPRHALEMLPIHCEIAKRPFVIYGCSNCFNAPSKVISTHLEQRCYSLPVVTILETFFPPVLHVHTFYLLLGEKTCTKKRKKKKHTHMTREHMEKGEKKVDKTEDKRVVHSFTFSLSFSYNRFFLSITVYIKTESPIKRQKARPTYSLDLVWEEIECTGCMVSLEWSGTNSWQLSK